MILYCKAVLGRGQSGLMWWILLWNMPLVQERLLDLLTSSPTWYGLCYISPLLSSMKSDYKCWFHSVLVIMKLLQYLICPHNAINSSNIPILKSCLNNIVITEVHCTSTLNAYLHDTQLHGFYTMAHFLSVSLFTLRSIFSNSFKVYLCASKFITVHNASCSPYRFYSLLYHV